MLFKVYIYIFTYCLFLIKIKTFYLRFYYFIQFTIIKIEKLITIRLRCSHHMFLMTLMSVMGEDAINILNSDK